MAKLKPDYIEWVLKLNATQAQEEYHKLEKESKELKSLMNANRKEMAQLEAQGKKNSSEWKNLAKSNGNYSRQLSENRKKLEELTKRMDINSMSVKQLKTRLNELKREFNNTSKATNPQRYKELRTEIIRVQGAIDKANASARGLRGSFFSLKKMQQTLIGFFNGIGLTIVGLVTGAFSNAFNLIVDFEKANSRLASILGTTTKGISELTAGARQLGATTSYSAAQVTNLQIELAKLGFSKEQILDMEGAVLKFAKAVDTDLASASAFAGAALRIFGKDATQTEDVLATFAVATTKTALDFSKLATSLSIVGPVANSFGLSIEDTTALLGQLANAGFDASSAATATRNIILNLCDANGDLAKALGHPVKNAEDLASGLQKLNAEGVDLAKALDLTDKRSVAAFSTFLEQSGNLVTLRDSITGVTADFNEMSATMGDNVAGAMAGLRSAAEELVLKISSGTNGPIKDLIKGLTWFVQKTGDGIAVMQEHGKQIKTIAEAILSYKLAVLLLNKAKAAKLALTKSIKKIQDLYALSVIESIALRYETVDFYSSVFSVFQDSDGNDVQGWKINAGLPCIMPRSMYRAFDGAKTLFQILGGIDCRLMGTNGMRYAFRNCRDLHRIRLFNIQDVITELDLSWSPNISPVVLHQLTFWHNGSSWAGRADSAEPFVILIHPKAWDDYQDERYWSQIYSTFTYEQWISNMKAKKVSIYVMDHENPANSDYVLEPAGTRSVAGMMSARQLSSAEEAGSEDIEADGQSDASDSYTLKDSEVDPAALPGVQSLDGGEAES